MNRKISPILFFLFLVISLSGIGRNPGKWKSIPLNPAVGRVVDVEFDPNDGDRLYAAPDANGIWYTNDLGKHWECITDNIPEIDARISNGEIMVDPDNFDKVYYVSKYGHYYITSDRGRSWQRVIDKNGNPVFLTDFKRALLSRDAGGKLTIVATTIGTDHGKKSGDWGKGIHVSHDEGLSWKHFPDPSKEEQYLEIALHPTNPKIIYAPSTLKLYKSVDGGKTFSVAFDYPEPKGGFSSIATIESNPDWVFMVTTSKENKAAAKDSACSALFLSKDAGKTWETIQNMNLGIGYNKSVYNEGFVGSWLHCFAVNSSNPDEMITASNVMNTTHDGGKTWTDIPWYLRMNVRNADGSLTPNKYGKHIADNHVIKFHPKYKSRAYKVCDSGLYVKDPDSGFESWVEITGDMDAMLFYSVKVNEFGDRYIIGNTQDVDIQTYQYGEWKNARGYEGDVVFIHPYTNFAYYPYCMCNDGTEIKGLFDLEGENASITSWGRPQIAVNYSKPNEAFILYKPNGGRRNHKLAFITDDYGKTADTVRIPAKSDILYLSVSRTKKQVVTAVAEEGVFVSADNGKTWDIKNSPSNKITFGASDPDHPNRIWVSTKNGEVFETLDSGNNWQPLSDGLPKGEILKLIYHEGSARDLYALVVDGDGQFMRPRGVYYLSATSNTWEPWMDGYKLAGFSDMVIDYPSQRLLASSYGRGVWEADLVNPCERFISGGVEVIQSNATSGFRTFTLDIPYFLPEYYNYRWMVNGQYRGENSLWFTSSEVKKNDLISCNLSSKASPDVKVASLPFRVGKERTEAESSVKSLLTCEAGGVDLGYYDFFGANSDFSIDFMIKPESDGVILSNRRLNDHDAKGFIVYIEGADLKVKYAAQYHTEKELRRDRDSITDQSAQLKAPVSKEKWSHVAVVFDRKGMAKLFVNGEKVDEQIMNPSELGAGLNSLFHLIMFSDIFGAHPLKASLDELRIFNKAMKSEDILKLLKTAGVTGGTKAYFSFDSNSVENLTEFFTGQQLKTKGMVRLEEEATR